MGECWICGDAATSGEHIIKKSDLKMLFGHVTQQNPIYLHFDHQHNVPAKGLNASVLKSPAPLCARCNNTRSASYDRAWQAVSQYIYERTKGGRKLARFSLKQVPHRKGVSSRQVANGLQLFFVKLWGCRLAEENPKHLALPGFARAFLAGHPHPNVRLRLKWDENKPKLLTVAATEHREYSNDEHIAMMTWGYSVGRLFVHLSYSEQPLREASWHPRDGLTMHIRQSYG